MNIFLAKGRREMIFLRLPIVCIAFIFSDIDCSSGVVQIQLLDIQWDGFFISIKGNIIQNAAMLYFLKTYSRMQVDEDYVVSEGKSTSVPVGHEFNIRIRSQGVFSIFLLAEDSHTRCKSPLLDIPLSKHYARMS